jgi:hypothetical protein
LISFARLGYSILGIASFSNYSGVLGLSSAVEIGGQLGSTTDEWTGSLSLENVSPKE